MKRLLLTISISLISSALYAGPKEVAWKMHNRLTGVPPKADVLAEMSQYISAGQPEKAAELATQNPLFYNIVLKNWIKPWSNVDQTKRLEFNDYVATILGVIRDDIPFDKILYDDIIYTINSTAIPAVSKTSNNHYKDAENRKLNLVELLTQRKQSEVLEIPVAAVAGVTTTRFSAFQYFSAGTNRRVNRFIFMNYLCKDYEDLHDTTIPDYRVRRDVERDPGGDSRTYKNKCVGCHAGQDALGGAYAYHNYNANAMSYTAPQIQGKMNQNNLFKDGFVTTDDSWINLWATGQNASLGWRGEIQGRGPASLGKMFARSKAFSQCMAKKVYSLVCVKEAKSSSDMAFVEKMANEFEQNNEYNMKNLLIKTSAGCITE